MARRSPSVKLLLLKQLLPFLWLVPPIVLFLGQMKGWDLAYYHWVRKLFYRNSLRLPSYLGRSDSSVFDTCVFAVSCTFCLGMFNATALGRAGLANRRRYREAVIRRRMQKAGLLDGRGELSADEFLKHRAALARLRSGNPDEFTGVYILHNETKDMYYVGQSVRVLQRVTQHLTGHGSGDVYADFKYGDRFMVRTVPLVDSGYQSLNDLERDMIMAYDAYENGYNNTRGNAR